MVAFYLTPSLPCDSRDRVERERGENTHGGGTGRELELRRLPVTTSVRLPPAPAQNAAAPGPAMLDHHQLIHTICTIL